MGRVQIGADRRAVQQEAWPANGVRRCGARDVREVICDSKIAPARPAEDRVLDGSDCREGDLVEDAFVMEPAGGFPGPIGPSRLEELGDGGFNGSRIGLAYKGTDFTTLAVKKEQGGESAAPFGVDGVDELLVLYGLLAIAGLRSMKLLQELFGVGVLFRIVRRDGDELEAPRLQTAFEVDQFGHLLPAAGTPGSPEIVEHYFPLITIDEFLEGGLVDSSEC